MCDKTTKFFHRMRVGENREPHPQFERLKSETREWFYTQMLSKRNEETKRRVKFNIMRTLFVRVTVLSIFNLSDMD